MSKLTKLVRDHREGCRALEHVARGWWSSPWFMNGGSVRRDSIGRRVRANASGQTWLRMICNCTDCDAEILVRRDGVEALVEANRDD